MGIPQAWRRYHSDDESVRGTLNAGTVIQVAHTRNQQRTPGGRSLALSLLLREIARTTPYYLRVNAAAAFGLRVAVSLF